MLSLEHPLVNRLAEPLKHETRQPLVRSTGSPSDRRRWVESHAIHGNETQQGRHRQVASGTMGPPSSSLRILATDHMVDRLLLISIFILIPCSTKAALWQSHMSWAVPRRGPQDLVQSGSTDTSRVAMRGNASSSCLTRRCCSSRSTIFSVASPSSRGHTLSAS